jgi:hypothetical protein
MINRALVLAVAFVAALGWARPAAADTIAFDINGTGTAGGSMTLDHFDWDAGNSMIIESGGTFTLLYQANLDSAVASPVSGSILDCSVAGGCLTAVAMFSVTQTVPGLFSVNSGGTFAIYADTTYANDLTGGTAFADGTEILSGQATGSGTITFAFSPTAPISDLDQHNSNDWTNYYTLEGAGGFSNIRVDIQSWNTTYFLSSLSNYSLALAINNGSNTVPFLDVDPTTTFWNGQAGVSTVCGPGQTVGSLTDPCINGTGDHIMAQSDATTTFRLTPAPVPEPSTLTLLGLGAVGAIAAGRRQLRSKKNR